jgi:hypothetical protein
MEHHLFVDQEMDLPVLVLGMLLQEIQKKFTNKTPNKLLKLLYKLFKN